MFHFQNNNIQVMEEAIPLPFLSNIWQQTIFSNVICVSWYHLRPLVLAKQMVKNVRWFSFRPTKNLNQSTLFTNSERYKDNIINLNQGGMLERDILYHSSYLLKSTKNNYGQRYNTIPYFSSICRTA